MVPSRILLLISSFFFLSTGCRTPDPLDTSIPEGFLLDRGRGDFSVRGLANENNLNVFYTIPDFGELESMPVLIVIHGADRNAPAYREAWVEEARNRGCLVFVPEFTASDFPNSPAFQQGGILNTSGNPAPIEDRTTAIIEPLFDSIQSQLGYPVSQYDLWGHSAGAQFVHRTVMFEGGQTRVHRAIAANAGWYTVPDDNVAFPYGMANSGLTTGELGAAMSVDLTVHLGELDNEFSATAWQGAYAQGDSRIERGHHFFDRASQSASENGHNLEWNLSVVAGVGHNHVKMAQAAAELLYP